LCEHLLQPLALLLALTQGLTKEIQE
jgi:hypothetical protein